MLKALYGTRVRELNIAIAQGNTVNFCTLDGAGNDSNLLIVSYVQIMPDDFVMQLHRF